MSDIFYAIPWYIACPLVMFIVIGLSILGLIIARRHVSHEFLLIHNEIVGYTIGLIGVLYALQLAFTMFIVEDRYHQLHLLIHNEANVLADLYRSAIILPPERRDAIRDTINNYITIVREKESKSLSHGERELEALQQMNVLWSLYDTYTPKNEMEKIWFDHSVTKLEALSNYRLHRLHYSTETLDFIMWTFLISGGVLLVAFMYLFGVKSFAFHAVITAALAGCLTFIILIIIYLDNGFLGVEGIKFHALEHVQDNFKYYK